MEANKIPNSAQSMTREQILEVALNVGKPRMKSGADTSRVEDTIMRFCQTCGYHEVNVFVTPTVILVGDKSAPNSTMMSRIRNRSTNLSNISEINDFSYNISQNPVDYPTAMSKLQHFLQPRPPYGKWMLCLA